MQCSKCGIDLPADSKFCIQCGTRIETTEEVESEYAKDEKRDTSLLGLGCQKTR